MFWRQDRRREGRGDTLILMRDEPITRSMRDRHVESLVGARAEVAGDGLAVLASVERERLHRILLDLDDARPDGFQVTRRSTPIPPRQASRSWLSPHLARNRTTARALSRRAATNFVRKPFDLTSWKPCNTYLGVIRAKRGISLLVRTTAVLRAMYCKARSFSGVPRLRDDTRRQKRSTTTFACMNSCR
jgi:CheY-like chemotaxis protein